MLSFLLHPLAIRFTENRRAALLLYVLLLIGWGVWCHLKRPDRKTAIHSFLFITYSAFLLMQLFLCRPMYDVPLNAVWGDWFPQKNERGEWSIDCIYNLLAFLPFSYLGCALFRHKRIVFWVLICMLCSALMECAQYLFQIGAFQISDIVYNAASGGIGAAIYHKLTFNAPSQTPI